MSVFIISFGLLYKSLINHNASIVNRKRKHDNLALCRDFFDKGKTFYLDIIQFLTRIHQVHHLYMLHFLNFIVKRGVFLYCKLASQNVTHLSFKSRKKKTFLSKFCIFFVLFFLRRKTRFYPFFKLRNTILHSST